ncbi:MAG TPA: hypothetical protein VF474_15050 [Phenylobacterium sp.]
MPKLPDDPANPEPSAEISADLQAALEGALPALEALIELTPAGARRADWEARLTAARAALAKSRGEPA